MRTRTGILIGCLLLIGCAYAFADSETEIACAKFAGNGMLAEVSIQKGALHLQLPNEGKTPAAPVQQVSPEASNCELFFSADNQWLAIGTEHAVKSGWSVRVQVWNVQKKEWHAQFDVDPKPGLTGYVSLAGFFEQNNELVITGRQSEERNAPLTSMLVNMDGKIVDGPDYPRDVPAEVDTGRNRVWSSKGADKCLMTAAPLVGNLIPGPEVTRPPIQGNCIGPSPIGFPKQNTTIGAASDGDGKTWAWSILTDTNKSNVISLAPPAKHALDKWVQATVQPSLSISPDGQVFAVQRTSMHWSHFDQPRDTVNEIVVVALEPLHFLQVVKPKACSSVSAFAVDHHGDHVEVVGRWCGKWMSTTIPISRTRDNLPLKAH
ncbi:MAG TPA: hypothetical protein VKR57_05820 [Terriglobales bacterium]|nr:hypothetical protein [Terriglobales bacterium]